MVTRIFVPGSPSIGRVWLRVGGTGGGASPPPDPDPPSGTTAISLTSLPVASGASAGVQRDIGATSGSPIFAGTYSGVAPSGVEARVLRVSDDSVVKDWTALSGVTIGGGSYSGKLAGVPQGAGYYRQVRCANATSVTASDAKAFMIGIGLACYGQSNMNAMLGASTAPEAANANTTLFDGTNWIAVPHADGARVLLNTIATVSGVPCFATNGSQNGTGLDALGKGHGSGYYAAFLARVQAMQGAEFFLWRHGESAASGFGMLQAEYLSRLGTLHGDLATDLGRTKAQIPGIVSTLATTSTGFDTVLWDDCQRTLIECGTLPSIVMSHSNMDETLLDGLHTNGAGSYKAGKRYARAVTTLLGLTTGYAKFAISGGAVVSDTTTTISIVHGSGTDFTPSTGITGFEVSGDNGATWVTPTADRTNATTITLTHAALATDSNRKVRYQFGKSPDMSNPILDNSDMAAPLLPSAGLIAPTPLASVPVPTYHGFAALADNGATKSGTALAIGSAYPTRQVMLALQGGGPGSAPTSVTFTPNVGSPVVATLVRDSPATGPRVLFYQAVVPTGTTMNVAVVFAGNPYTNFEVAFWSVDNSTLTSSTPSSSSANGSATGPSSISTGVTNQANGFTLAIANMRDYTGNSGSTIAGSVSSFNTRRSASSNGGWNLVADASGTPAGAETVTATFVLNTAALSIAAVHYR